MALIFADGFDHYGTSPNGGRDAMLAGAWAEITSSSAGSFQVSTSQARTGAYSLNANVSGGTGSAFARRVFGANLLTFGIAFGVYLLQIPGANNGAGMTFRNPSNGTIFALNWMSDGSIGIKSGDHNGTVIAQSDPVITAQTWNHVEIRFAIDTTVGSIEVRLNGQPVINQTDMNLGSTAVAGFTFNRFVSNPSNTTAFFIDDLVVWDSTGAYMNDFIGPCRVENLLATADTAQADWSVTGAADGYAAINEVPPDGDDSYISAGTAGDISEFEFGTLSPETDIIRGVYVATMARIDEAGSGNLQVSLVSDNEVALGADNALTTAYTYRGDVFMVDPNTDEPWEPEALEAALIRFEKTA